MTDTNFIIKEIPERELAVLRITGELDFDKRKDFATKTDELLKSSQPKIVIDLTSINRIFSVYLGTIVDVHQQAKAKGKSFSVLANKSLIKLFEQANINEIVNIISVEK